MAETDKLTRQCVNTLRTLAMDAVEAAQSGHPGMPMGMADAAFILWTKFLRHNPSNPEWFNRDRFILSAGHGSMLLYSLLHLTGYDLSLKELKNFRQLHSKTPGHPEYGWTPGVETTTGPLGQGFATGIGMAMAEAHLAEMFNKSEKSLVDHYIYGIVSDGDLMEGISHEAASFAGHQKLGKIVYLYDSNRITIDGSTDLAFTEDVASRFSAYNWHTIEVDGHDHSQLEQAIEAARQTEDRPSLIICRTHIGFGSPNKQDSADSHGAPLGTEEVKLTKERLGWEAGQPFTIPDEVLEFYRRAIENGRKAEEEWNRKVESLEKRNPEQAALFRKYLYRELPEELENYLPVFDPDPKGMATRKASGSVLNQIAPRIPQLVGGSADLTGSNKTELSDYGLFQPGSRSGRNVHYGVREHAMAAALNGMALHSGIIPYGGTFLIFSDYCRPAIRIAALSKIPSIFVLTHDSIGLGEDGPTHQPVEHLASLRAMPNCVVLRPADANETSWAWKAALERTSGPTVLALTRQSLPVLERSDEAQASNVMKGGYTFREASSPIPELILIATGSELQIALEAAERLEAEGMAVRVVSMPSWELFEEQDPAYRERVLPSEVKNRISIEAASTFGWSRWVGNEGTSIGLDRFGESAPWKDLYEHFGLTADRVVEVAVSRMSRT